MAKVILFLLLLVSAKVQGQFGAFGGIIANETSKGIAKRSKKISAKKREAFVSANLQYRVFGNDSTKVLRATKESAGDYALLIQDKLEKIHQALVSTTDQTNLSNNILQVRMQIRTLSEQDENYPAEYCENEALFYDQCNGKKQKQIIELERIHRENEKNELQKWQLAENQRIQEEKLKKKEADSLRIVKNTKGYHFANASKIYVYPKAEKGKAIAEVGQASYIVVIDTVRKTGFFKITFGDEKIGFVEIPTLVDNIFKIEDKTTTTYESALRDYYESFIEYKNYDFGNTTTTITPEGTTRTNSTNTTNHRTEKERVWHTGPNGGVYYINEKGNKIYKGKSKK